MNAIQIELWSAGSEGSERDKLLKEGGRTRGRRGTSERVFFSGFAGN